MASQDDRSYLTSIAIGFSIAITCIAVILRLLARKLHKIPVGADDYASLLGAVNPKFYTLLGRCSNTHRSLLSEIVYATYLVSRNFNTPVLFLTIAITSKQSR